MQRVPWLLVVCLAIGAFGAEDSSANSNIIPSAGEAELFNGNGDISDSGPCKSEIKSFCKDIKAGENRLSACLTKRIAEVAKGNAVGKKVSQKCQDAISEFKMDRSSHINKDVPLAKACKADVAKYCKSFSDNTAPGSVLGCLRSGKKTAVLNEACKSEVWRTQYETSQDYRLDYKLRMACGDDAANLCADVEDGGNRVMECLTSKRIQVSWECQDQMFRNDVESNDDIRLISSLFNKCFSDFKRYCKDVEPGHMQVQECLEDNMDKDKFSEDCKEELENVLAKRVADFRLDGGLRQACEEDLSTMCGATLQAMDDDKKVQQTALNCLQQYREDIKSSACKAEVHRRTERAAKDIRFDDVLADACFDDREKYCHDILPGSARVIRCLEEHRRSLGPQCAAALFDHEVKMAEDIDFKYPMKKACGWEISTFCKNVPHGHARIVRCLEENLDHDDMSKECKSEVMRDMNRMATDYRLNYRLNNACKDDITKLCNNHCSDSPGQSCGGMVLQCLQEAQDQITSEACQEEVFYYELMEVSDFRNDVILAEACREDVEAYCKDVEPGEGRVHSCLRFNRDKVSPKCMKEENKLAALEYRDIRLRPKLNKLCSEEKAVYCKEVKPGKARVVKCLMENMAQPDFGEECREELQKREDGMKSDYRYDIGVFTNCANDVESYCQAEKSMLRGTAAVLKCLVTNFNQLAEQCQSEMSRAVRLALWDYKPGAALTAACDSDVESQCPKGAVGKSGTIFTIGVVGRCLSKALVQGKSMDSKCRNMVLVAAPKDARAYFEYPESTNAVVQKIADLQRAAGMDAMLVDPYARSGGTVTVTGWVALLCILSIIIVTVGSLVVLYRRATGQDKPHTMHVKMGDA